MIMKENTLPDPIPRVLAEKNMSVWQCVHRLLSNFCILDSGTPCEIMALAMCPWSETCGFSHVVRSTQPSSNISATSVPTSKQA